MSHERRHGATDRDILRLALPAFGALIAEPLYILADTAVVGHLGTPELAGLAVAAVLLVTGHSLFIFLAYGTTATVARLLGAGDERRAAHEAVQGMWLALGIGIVLAGAGLVAAEGLVGLMGAEEAIREHALIYFRISLAGLPAMLLGFAGTGYLRGLQNTRLPLVITIASSLFNLVFELVLIYGFGFGIGASALSTVVAQIGGAAVYVAVVRREVAVFGAPMRPDAASLRSLGRSSFDLFLRTAALRATLVAATAVATRLGTVEVAAHQIAFELWNFLALALDAIAIAGQALTGRFLGAGDTTAARAAGRRMLLWGLTAGVIFGAAIVATRALLPGLFTSDEAVVSLAAYVLWFVAALQPLNGIVFVLDGILIGAGDLRFLAWAMAGAAAGFLPAVGLVLVFDAGLGALWCAIGLWMLLRGIGLLARFHGSAWQVTGPQRAVVS